MKTKTHTPTPWHYEIIKEAQDQINIYPENRNEGWIANTGPKHPDGDRFVNEANAEFIVRTVNENAQIKRDRDEAKRAWRVCYDENKILREGLEKIKQMATNGGQNTLAAIPYEIADVFTQAKGGK